MAKAKKETPQQILEAARGAMSKDEFAAALGISRQWYHQVLTGDKDIDLETLHHLSVDYRGEWLGKLGDELIVAWYGVNYLPIGSREELVKMRQFLKETEYEDLVKVGRSLHPDHFPLWAAELRKRLDEQLDNVRKQMHAEVAA